MLVGAPPVWSSRILGTAFPYHTMFENVSGSFVMGLLAGYFAFRGSASQHWQLFLTTGILGGYTTFSAFSLDTALLYERSSLGLAAVYVIGSVALSIGGLFAGSRWRVVFLNASDRLRDRSARSDAPGVAHVAKRDPVMMSDSTILFFRRS
jgi:CrcB protein